MQCKILCSRCHDWFWYSNNAYMIWSSNDAHSMECIMQAGIFHKSYCDIHTVVYIIISKFQKTALLDGINVIMSWDIVTKRKLFLNFGASQGYIRIC